MQVVMLHGPRDVRLDTGPDPHGPPAAGHIRIRTLATAVSTGTEVAAYTARYGMPFYGWPFEYPTALGYLNVGRVEALAPDVAAPSPGDIVYTFGEHRSVFDRLASEPWWHVPAGVDPAVASFSYLISLGAHGLRRAGLVPGERVAVVGLGAVGLGAVAIARQYGSHVTAIDPLGLRRDLALRLGADVAIDPGAEDPDAVGGVGADVVIEAAGSWPAVRTAYGAARDQGRVAIVALHPQPGDFSPFGESFYSKQLTVVSTSFQPPQDLPAHQVRFTLRRGCQDVLDRLGDGRLDFRPAVTHRVPFRELPALYPQLEAGTLEAGAIAVVYE